MVFNYYKDKGENKPPNYRKFADSPLAQQAVRYLKRLPSSYLNAPKGTPTENFVLEVEAMMDKDSYTSGKSFLDDLLKHAFSSIYQVSNCVHVYAQRHLPVCHWQPDCLSPSCKSVSSLLWTASQSRSSVMFQLCLLCLLLFVQGKYRYMESTQMANEQWQEAALSVLLFREQYGGWPWREL